MKYFIEGHYDVVIVGAGHAGCEAGLATARLGNKTLIMTMSMESVADLPCNPNIGGTGKGHLVREIDALGGEMAINIDKTFIQSRMLNTSKGPAVHSLRVQADKRKYHEEMKKVLEAEPNLTLVEQEAEDLVIEDGVVKGVKARSGAMYMGQAVILATGTFLRGEILMGDLRYSSGPSGKASSEYLSKSLEDLDIPLRRFKTGTPARVHRHSVDIEAMIPQPGDEEIIPFSFLTDPKDVQIDQLDCYLTYTTEETKEIIERNIERSPMYSGMQAGIGPRYCPSIEDKIVRFPERVEHQVFLEPEGLSTVEMYVQGVSSTLPYDVQIEFYNSIRHMEGVKIMRPAHGIEYDTVDPTVLKRTLEHKDVENLFFAGQICGSSGYEEAAAQGLIAGLNAHSNIKGLDSFVLDRSDAYIGVLIDDLVTKGTEEPYRMMTSRAEYRLTLRQDNADLRLTEKGYEIGLVTEERYKKYQLRKTQIDEELERIKKIRVNPTEEINSILEEIGTSPIRTSTSLEELLRRPELGYDSLAAFDPERPNLSRDVIYQIEVATKYEGYIKKQMAQINQFKRLESRSLDHIEDYNEVEGLSAEGIQKLNEIKPDSVGQASRISGVTPADINVILVHLEVRRRNE